MNCPLLSLFLLFFFYVLSWSPCFLSLFSLSCFTTLCTLVFFSVLCIVSKSCLCLLSPFLISSCQFSSFSLCLIYISSLKSFLCLLSHRPVSLLPFLFVLHIVSKLLPFFSPSLFIDSPCAPSCSCRRHTLSVATACLTLIEEV